MARKGRNIEHKRNLRFRSAVLGDGQTELYYLKHLKEVEDGLNYTIRPRLFSSITIEKAGTYINDLLKEGYDLVVYFTDYDKIIEDNKVDRFEKLRKRFESKNVMICESMPSIEFWFLLHYVETTRIFNNADEVAKELKKFIPDFSKEKGFLENRKWVEELSGDNKIELAKQRAIKILTARQNNQLDIMLPFTKAHEGIEKLKQ